jgi:hypothetical protein
MGVTHFKIKSGAFVFAVVETEIAKKAHLTVVP